MSVATGYYQHYKGAHYQVVGVARHSETDEALVVYRTCYGDRSLWVRPLSMFTEMVDTPQGRIPRFRYVGNTEPKD